MHAEKKSAMKAIQDFLQSATSIYLQLGWWFIVELISCKSLKSLRALYLTSIIFNSLEAWAFFLATETKVSFSDFI